MEDIMYLDQLLRSSKYGKGSELHAKYLGRYTDSVNFVRVKALIESGRYPTFANYGIMSSRYNIVLMHIGDHDEQEWQYLFSFLKQQVLKGDITTKEVVTIVNRHFISGKTPCNYYGSSRHNAYPICDCNNVDAVRLEVGLDSMINEYRRVGKPIPDCYGK